MWSKKKHNPNKTFCVKSYKQWAEDKAGNERDKRDKIPNHAETNESGTVRGGQVMEYSETALPTCYRILYYYGDFSLAPSFA